MSKKDDKKSSKKPANSAQKFEQELPDIAKKYGLRVSKPYGYYPDDVNAILEKLDGIISDLEKENIELGKKAEETEKKYAAVQQEFVSFKIRVQTLNLQPTTLEQDVEMTENAVKEIVKPKPAKQLNFKPANVVKPKNNPVPAKAPTKSTFNNLISKKKSGG